MMIYWDICMNSQLRCCRLVVSVQWEMHLEGPHRRERKLTKVEAKLLCQTLRTFLQIISAVGSGFAEDTCYVVPIDLLRGFSLFSTNQAITRCTRIQRPCANAIVFP